MWLFDDDSDSVDGLMVGGWGGGGECGRGEALSSQGMDIIGGHWGSDWQQAQ